VAIHKKKKILKQNGTFLSSVAKALEISGARSKIATAVYKQRYIKEQFYDYDH